MPPTTATLVLVTENLHKVAEWTAICADLAPWLAIKAWAPTQSVVEDAPTLAGNAQLKAQAGLALLQAKEADAVVGEDTGLEVPALAGLFGLNPFPGVHTNRWLTPDRERERALPLPDGLTGSARLNAALLHLMHGLTAEQRAACYHCALAAMVCTEGSATPTLVTAEGTWGVTAGLRPEGEGGFGYDPIMQTLDDGIAIASLPPAIKNQHSHRALAIQQLLPQLFPQFMPVNTALNASAGHVTAT
jgi:XTP/dITP diphosphohydrolase